MLKRVIFYFMRSTDPSQVEDKLGHRNREVSSSPIMLNNFVRNTSLFTVKGPNKAFSLSSRKSSHNSNTIKLYSSFLTTADVPGIENKLSAWHCDASTNYAQQYELEMKTWKM